MDEPVRVDKWLWTVRIYKTRNQASEACCAGKIKIAGLSVKPSREVKKDDIIVISQTPIQKTLQVIELLKNRVGAKLVANYALDLTPPEEYEKLKMTQEMNFEHRDRSTGRPTKKQRRLIDFLKADNTGRE
ncbi:MAG: RNA-binding S4 domain-containing protein [Bacteroidales bacterium]|nr:RNA-binding S4 domain-containing protein [Bacteroidales bacterium]MDZ4204553.1 RNA-binding S4 domain-containing protein [Bacteroidales bacterium]